MLLDEDLPLEIDSVAEFHEFMRVAGVAILAGELASAIRIDSPGERQIALAHHAIQQRMRPEREVLYVVAFAEGLALRRDPGDAHQFLTGLGIGKERKRRHTCRRWFAFCSPKTSAIEARCQSRVFWGSVFVSKLGELAGSLSN